jgi:recombination protein RecT
MSNEIEKPQASPLAQLKHYLSDEGVRKRFEEILGKRAGSFMNSIINVYRGSAALHNCTPDSIVSSALVAATLDLPIDPALGFAAIVPYKTNAQFQLMWKGIIQLCIRSGQYARINVTEIYADELKGYNPITGEVTFNDPVTFKLRYDVNPDGVVDCAHVVGFYAYFRLLSGFEGSMYMSKDQVLAHGKRFSKAFQYDVKEKKRVSLWSTDLVSMGRKTVAKLLLGRFGIMSVEMQDAFVRESVDFEDAAQAAEARIAAETGSKSVDAKISDSPKTGDEQAAKKKKGKKTGKAETEGSTGREPGEDPDEAGYACMKCGSRFANPVLKGPDNKTMTCPGCGSLQVAVAGGK